MDNSIEQAAKIAEKVNSENYPSYAMKTEIIPSDPVLLTDDQARAMMTFLEAVHQLDTAADGLKRNIFYGKGLSAEEIIETLPIAVVTDQELGVLGRNSALYPIEHRLFHAFLGQFTELIEMLRILQVYFQGVTPEIDLFHVGEERGDVCWYDAIIENVTGLYAENCKIANVAKLAFRHGDKFNAAKVVDRDLAAERLLLEKFMGLVGSKSKLNTGRPAEQFNGNAKTADNSKS